MLSPLGTNISAFKGTFEDELPFPMVGYGLVSWRVSHLTWKTAVATLISINLKPLKPAIELPKKNMATTSYWYVFQVPS